MVRKKTWKESAPHGTKREGKKMVRSANDLEEQGVEMIPLDLCRGWWQYVYQESGRQW